jgi:hypothetical protein
VSYWLSHWRGQHSFIQAFVVNAMVPVIGLLALQHTVLEPLIQQHDRLRGPLQVALALIYLVFITMATVSVNRKSRITQAQTYGAGYSVMACNTGLFIAACVIAVNLVDIQTTGITTLSPAREAFEPIALYTDKEDPSIFHLQGELNPFTPERFENAIAETGTIKTLVLDSPGGHVFAARAIAKRVRQLNIDTHVEGQCHSSCTLVYISGNRRSIAPAGRLGFHGYKYTAAGTLYKDIQQQQDTDASIFQQQGVKADFIEAIFTTPPQKLWQPSLPELQSAGVVDEIVSLKR